MTPQELKESILLLAAQGKLVPQLEIEGSGLDIINTISSQRATLETKGHLKKRKPLPEISESEIPFDIPDSWVWVRVYDLADVCQTPFADGPFGSNLKSEHYTNAQEVRIIQLSNIGENGWKDQNVKYTTYDHLKTIQRSEVAQGDIVIAKMMPAGRAIIVPNGESKYVLSSDAVKFVAHPTLDKMYLYYVINSQAFRNQVYSEVQGITRVRTSLQKLITYLLPIPSLSEQKRIVAKIEELLPYINRYEQAWSKLEDFNKRFPTDMQKSILQTAIQGKLVEQRPEEGTGEELFQQVQAEKQKLIIAGAIKKENPLPEIKEDEKPFDIPESWKWVRLGNLVSVRGGKRLPAGDNLTTEPTKHVYIRVTDMQHNSVDQTDLHYITDTIYAKISSYIITKGDLYIVIVGSTIGKVGSIPEQLDGMNLTENAARLTPQLIDKDYLLNALKTDSLQKQFIDKTHQVGQPKLALIRLKSAVVPVPPLAEQKRIVAKLEEILPLCEKLK